MCLKMGWVPVFIILPRFIRVRQRNLVFCAILRGVESDKRYHTHTKRSYAQPLVARRRRGGHGVTLNRLSGGPYFNQLSPTFCFAATFPYFYPYFFTLKCHFAIKVQIFFLAYFSESRPLNISIFYILKVFRNAPFYNHCLFRLADLRMFLLYSLSAYTMDHYLP